MRAFSSLPSAWREARKRGETQRENVDVEKDAGGVV